jgi:hypothetical protein
VNDGGYHYEYTSVKHELFTDRGHRHFIEVRDWVKTALENTGAFQMGKAMVGSGDTFLMMACVDRMVELGEIIELKRACWAQFRVFTTPQVDNR